MAYVINHGDKTGRSFHHFVDLCTKAYNLIRVRWHDVLSLLYLSLPMGLTTLKGTSELKYILANLSPTSDTFQAQQTFTKLIKESHGNISVKLNFWVHGKCSPVESVVCLCLQHSYYRSKISL